MKFKNVNDVRSLISSTFKTTEYVKFNHTEDAIRELYAKSEWYCILLYSLYYY